MPTAAQPFGEPPSRRPCTSDGIRSNCRASTPAGTGADQPFAHGASRPVGPTLEPCRLPRTRPLPPPSTPSGEARSSPTSPRCGTPPTPAPPGCSRRRSRPARRPRRRAPHRGSPPAEGPRAGPWQVPAPIAITELGVVTQEIAHLPEEGPRLAATGALRPRAAARALQRADPPRASRDHADLPVELPREPRARPADRRDRGWQHRDPQAQRGRPRHLRRARAPRAHPPRPRPG